MNAMVLPSRRVLAAGAIVTLAASMAAAQCRFPASPPPPAPNIDAETARIRTLLDQCRAFGTNANLGQQRLFTWGHHAKLRWLLDEPVIQSCEYNRERERSRAVYRFARHHGACYLALRPAVTSLLQPAPGNLREIRDRVVPPDRAEGVDLAEVRQLAMIVFVYPAAFEAASHARLLAVRSGEQSLIYVDRCAIDYRGGACRWFRVTDLTCDEAATLSRDAAHLRLMEEFFDDTDPDGEFLDALNQRCHSTLALY